MILLVKRINSAKSENDLINHVSLCKLVVPEPYKRDGTTVELTPAASPLNSQSRGPRVVSYFRKMQAIARVQYLKKTLLLFNKSK